MGAYLVAYLIFAASLLVAFVARIVWVLQTIRRHRKFGLSIIHEKTKTTAATTMTRTKNPPPLSTLIVLGSGGHTTELLFMTQHLDPDRYSPVHYCKASTDTTSLDRLTTMRGGGGGQSSNNCNSNAGAAPLHIHDIPRSREVGQSYLSSVFTTLHAALCAFALVLKLRPALIVCNGPGTCIPICIAATVYRIMGLFPVQIVFIESFCRVQTLSLTGRLVYYSVADLFVVHWSQLHQKFPDSILTSTYVRHE
jgi:beta-1,4-N-acetylglucosaminyltransferase